MNLPSRDTFQGRLARRLFLEAPRPVEDVDEHGIATGVAEIPLDAATRVAGRELLDTLHPLDEQPRTAILRPAWEPVVDEAALLAAFDQAEEDDRG
ncbi:hypothetical protein [Kineococcus terrestris]|uniref:hypothetical protein n=1 Tax=Kineococcus terrestris TaxID=2044856 RepID=UPI0034DAFD4B